MKYRKLGITDLKVSVIGVGTWQFGGEWGKSYSAQEVEQILGKAKELGINLIDTAECYGDHLSEQLIGKAIKKSREEWVIATKFGHHFHGHKNRTNHWTASKVMAQLDESLRALQTDYIDLYQFHSGPDEAFLQDELWTALDKQKQAGKIRHLGISIKDNDNLLQTEGASQVQAGAIQVVYNRLDRKAEQRVFPACSRLQLGVLARVPLASGYLTGKYQSGSIFPANDVRAGHDQQEREDKLRQVQDIRRSEVPEGVAMASWALAWCLQHPAVTCVIPGCKDVEQVILNAQAAELEMVRKDHPLAIHEA